MFHMGKVFVFAMGFDLLLNVAENISNDRTNSLRNGGISGVIFSCAEQSLQMLHCMQGVWLLPWRACPRFGVVGHERKGEIECKCLNFKMRTIGKENIQRNMRRYVACLNPRVRRWHVDKCILFWPVLNRVWQVVEFMVIPAIVPSHSEWPRI